MPEFTASYPAGPVESTAENLKAAAEGELAEWGTLYPDFGQVAEEEGFKKALLVPQDREVEMYHERRIASCWPAVGLAAKVFREEPRTMEVRECGYVHESPGAPKVCPVCGKPQSYFELYCECYG